MVLLAENTSGPLSSDTDELLLVEGDPVQLLAQAGVLVPAGQAGGGAEVMLNFDRRFGSDALWARNGSSAASSAVPASQTCS